MGDLSGWSLLAVWTLALVGWCAYQVGYRRGLRRSRALYEPVVDELSRQVRANADRTVLRYPLWARREPRPSKDWW